MFKYKPDFLEVLERYEAWWECRIVDRPLVSITFPKPEDEQRPPPETSHSSVRERWMDTEFTVASVAARKHNTVYFADSLPVAWPNLGPEIFSAFYGCEMDYGENTAWSKPILFDWSEKSVDRLRLDTGHFYFRKIVEMTDALLEAAKGKFIVGYTDLHGGGDAIAAFRDPQELLIDTIEHREEVKRLCDRVTTDFLTVYDTFHEKLSAAGRRLDQLRLRHYKPGRSGRGTQTDFTMDEEEVTMKIRNFQEPDREALTQITIISFDGVSIDRNIETLVGPQRLHLTVRIPCPEVKGHPRPAGSAALKHPTWWFGRSTARAGGLKVRGHRQGCLCHLPRRVWVETIAPLTHSSKARKGANLWI